MALNLVVIVARQALCNVFFTMSKFNAGESLHSERICRPTYLLANSPFNLNTLCDLATRFSVYLFSFKYIVFTTICQSVCLSDTFVGPMSLIITTFVSLSFVFICQYIIGTAKCPSAFLPSICILVYTCPFARLSVRPSHVSIIPTPLNISAIFTARCVCIAQTMS